MLSNYYYIMPRYNVPNANADMNTWGYINDSYSTIGKESERTIVVMLNISQQCDNNKKKQLQ